MEFTTIGLKRDLECRHRHRSHVSYIPRCASLKDNRNDVFVSQLGARESKKFVCHLSNSNWSKWFMLIHLILDINVRNIKFLKAVTFNFSQKKRQRCDSNLKTESINKHKVVTIISHLLQHHVAWFL